MSAPLITLNDGNKIPALGLGQSASASALCALIFSTPDRLERLWVWVVLCRYLAIQT